MCTIDLWCVVPEQIRPDEWATCELWLHDVEYARASRYQFERDRRLFLVGRALLRASLSRRSGRPPSDWRFITDSYGRTLLSGGGQWAFSVSHTVGAVVCAVGEGIELGIDVESPHHKKVWDDIMSIAFTAAERSRLARMTPFERATVACHLWTLKEAYSKARGLGLAIPFDRIGFDILDESVLFEPAIDVEPEPAKWSFLRLELLRRYCAAVSWTGAAEVLVRHVSSPLALLAGHMSP
jgi:4'-phosphopantetheinyl transferase